MFTSKAKYSLGQVVRHRKHPFRGVIFDVDPVFSNSEEWYEHVRSNSEEWYEAIPEDQSAVKGTAVLSPSGGKRRQLLRGVCSRPSEQNLVVDKSGEPVEHPGLPEFFGDFDDGQYPLQVQLN